MSNDFFNEVEMQRMHDVLNEYQVASVVEAVAAQCDHELLFNIKTLINTEGRDDVAEILINKVIIPHNMKKLSASTQQLIDDGYWRGINVFGDAEKPPFSYSVGMHNTLGIELFISGIGGNTPCSIINNIGDYLKEHLDTPPENINEHVCHAITLADKRQGRYRLKEVSLDTMLEKYMIQLKPHLGDKLPKVYIIELPDKNNILPGEEGYDESFKQIISP